MANADILFFECEPFSQFDEETRNQIFDLADQQSFIKGHVIFRELEAGDEIYFILDGNIVISVEFASAYHMVEDIEAGSGDLVGEGRFLVDSPRSATVTATSEVNALVWDVSQWKAFAQKRPDVGYQLALFSAQVLFKRAMQLKEHLLNDMAWGLE